MYLKRYILILWGTGQDNPLTKLLYYNNQETVDLHNKVFNPMDKGSESQAYNDVDLSGGFMVMINQQESNLFLG